MKCILNLRTDNRGAAMIEFAIALPVLIFIIYGIFESALLLKASAGMQHALGEGARRATIFPTPDSATVSTKVSDSLFGMENAKTGFPQISVADGNNSTQNWYTIGVTYQKDVNFLFLPSRTVTIQHSKRVYTAQ